MNDSGMPRSDGPIHGSDTTDSFDGGTRRYYVEFALQYAEETKLAPLPVTAVYLRELLSPGSRVLDLGCGAGRDLRDMSEIGLDAVGLDRSEALARIAADHSGLPVVVADFGALPFVTSSFDGVYAIASLLHASDIELRRALGEIKRCLRPDGMLFGSVKAGFGEEVDARGRFVRYYDIDALASAVSRAGFSSISIVPSVEQRPTENIVWLNLSCRST